MNSHLYVLKRMTLRDTLFSVLTQWSLQLFRLYRHAPAVLINILDHDQR